MFATPGLSWSMKISQTGVTSRRWLPRTPIVSSRPSTYSSHIAAVPPCSCTNCTRASSCSRSWTIDAWLMPVDACSLRDLTKSGHSSLLGSPFGFLPRGTTKKRGARMRW